ncbi:SapC family protein [Arenicella xantha]|uniref:SapC protein n=1 Tax=Arenicella xantha TaxID=644221 RepID=A0A395JGS6_9GAMM|nr:SapC family protein [Arenicella xantha]RBP48729.1 SapC protein [Arenicella xantha]
MTNYVLLNQAEHAKLRVITDRSAEYGDAVNFVMTFPFEFRNIQACYPIFFQKDPNTGMVYPVALLGFEQRENLFLTESGWNASYLPLMIKRQPFLIGFQADASDPAKRNAMVSIDIDNPRVNEENGEVLFLEHGGTSEFLQEATQSLELIHQAHQHSEKFVNKLIELELLEAFTLDIKLNNGVENQLMGYYTINEEKLQALTGDILGELSQAGFLQPIFMILASHARIATLVDLKNKSIVA